LLHSGAAGHTLSGSNEMSRQERFREEYRRRRPGWRDSLVIYRSIVAGHVGPCTRVLDLGCGHASWLAAELAPARFAAGLDCDLAGLRRNLAQPNRVAATAERLPFRDGAFDLVVSAWLLEHVERPAEMLAEARRVLCPGGRLVFLTPNAWNYNVWLIRLVPNRLHHRLVRRLYDREEGDTYPVRYRLNSPRRLGRVMAEAGFHRSELVLNGDPTYVGLNRPLFAAACALERLLELGPLARARVHLIGVYERS
jgi:SAM-dependent methyltransferase